MNEVTALLGFVLESIIRLGGVGAIIKQAQGEGREKLTPEEWAKLDTAFAEARQAETDAIAKAKAEGR